MNRREYAEAIVHAAGAISPALVDAFARVPREAFLGPGPWQVVTFPLGGGEATTDVYRDVGIVIDATKQLNNGQPSAHARWIAAADPRPGERVLHVGCGTGYYTAILAELVGATGRVVAREIEPALVATARANLAPWSQVTLDDDGGDYDVIYVNAGATHAIPAWLDGLRPNGRLLLPLTAHVPGFPHGVGVMLRIEHRGDRWPARVISPVGIYDCAGARDPIAEAQVRKLLGRTLDGACVIRTPHAQVPTCLVHVDGFCLA